MRCAKPTESQEQISFFAEARLILAARKIPQSLLYAVPNAQKFMSKARNIHAAYRAAVREGLTEGVCDINFDWPISLPPARIEQLGAATVLTKNECRIGLFHGLRIEMKRRPNKVEPAQEAHILALRQAGYNVIVAWNADEAIRALKGYLG